MSAITNSPLFTAGVVGMMGAAAVEGARALESSVAEYLPSQEVNGIAAIASAALLVVGIAHSCLRGPAVSKEVTSASMVTESDPVIEQRWPNVLLLGRTGTGKSNFKEVLKNPLYSPPEPKMYSTTREPTVEQVKMGGSEAFILDTPGVGDFVENKGEQLSDAQILAANDKAVETHFGGYQKVDRVFMTMRCPDERMDEDEIQSIRKCAQHLRDKGVKNLTLVLTHSEKYTPEQRAEYLSMARNASKFDKHEQKFVPLFDQLLKDFFADGKEMIFSGGLPSNGNWLWREGPASSSATLNRVLDLRRKVIEKIWGEAKEEVVWDFINSKPFDAAAKLSAISAYLEPPELEEELETEYTGPIPEGMKEWTQEMKDFSLQRYREQREQENAEIRARNSQLKQDHDQAVRDFHDARAPLFEAWARGELPGAPKRAQTNPVDKIKNNNNAQTV